MKPVRLLFGGEDGSRTRLDVFAGRIRTSKIKDLAQNHTFYHMSLHNPNLGYAQKSHLDTSLIQLWQLTLSMLNADARPLIDHQSRCKLLQL